MALTLVDVLQRVGTHPAKRVAELTPRLWKDHFADNPMRSDIDRVGNSVGNDRLLRKSVSVEGWLGCGIAH